MTSISLIEQLLLAEPACRGPAQCKHSPWTIKGRVHSLEHKAQIHKHKSKLSSTQRLSQSIQYHSGRRVLRSGGPNHSKIFVSLLCSSVHRSSAPKYPPNPSLTRIRRVLSATRLENSSDIWRAR
jgi:hypothetical protein